jgi:hypothetical protein
MGAPKGLPEGSRVVLTPGISIQGAVTEYRSQKTGVCIQQSLK